MHLEKLCFIMLNSSTHCLHYSQSGIDDDGVSLDGEAKNPGIFGCISEDDFLALCILLWEKTDIWDAVVLRTEGTESESIH